MKRLSWGLVALVCCTGCEPIPAISLVSNHLTARFSSQVAPCNRITVGSCTRLACDTSMRPVSVSSKAPTAGTLTLRFDSGETRVVEPDAAGSYSALDLPLLPGEGVHVDASGGEVPAFSLDLMRATAITRPQGLESRSLFRGEALTLTWGAPVEAHLTLVNELSQELLTCTTTSSSLVVPAEALDGLSRGPLSALLRPAIRTEFLAYPYRMTATSFGEVEGGIGTASASFRLE